MQAVILVVEDEPAIADNIVYALSTEGFTAIWRSTGEDALKVLEESQVDLVVLDVGLPDTSGFEVARVIRSNNDIPIIFVTARSDEIDRVAGLELGGDDYLVKPFSPRELAARVRAVLRRTSSASKQGDGRSRIDSRFTIDFERRIITFFGKPIELSRYEFGLMQALIENPGRVFSREQLMARVWDEPDMSLARTIDTHVKTLRKKLRDINSDTEVIITHRGVGYALKEKS